MKEKETYSNYYDCGNCGNRSKLEIPKGTKYKEYPCPHCGCEELFRVNY